MSAEVRLPAEEELLTRDDFRELALLRDEGRCVLCAAPASEVHHIFERRLFPDGGYYLGNAASVCNPDHQRCEQTAVSLEEVWEAAGIRHHVYPPHLYADEGPYDKWGNQILADGRRVRGELFGDESVQKVLRAGGVLELFTERVKYPRTFHVPFSPGVGPDDRVLSDLSDFTGRRVIVSEKLDGENSSIYPDGYLHARSVDGDSHPSQSRARARAAVIGPQLPLGWRLVGENLTAQHTIHYKALPGHVVMLSLWNERNECLSWDETVEWAGLLELPLPPVLYDGLFDESVLRGLYRPESAFGGEMEGWVMRTADAFPYRDFRRSVAKFVRAGHVPVHARHWKRGPVVENQLAG